MSGYCHLFGFLLTLFTCLPQDHFGQTGLERRADLHVHHGRLTKAADLYQKALAKDLHNDQLQLKLARISFQLDRSIDAFAYYTAVINQRYLVQSQDYLNYAQVLESLAKWNGAMKWARLYLTYEPRNETAQNILLQGGMESQDTPLNVEITEL